MRSVPDQGPPKSPRSAHSHCNHALLFTDLALKQVLEDQEGKEEKRGLLPAYSRVVLDEAHHIEEVARQFFTAKLSQRAIFSLLGRLSGEQRGILSLLCTQLTQRSLSQKGDFSPAIASCNSAYKWISLLF